MAAESSASNAAGPIVGAERTAAAEGAPAECAPGGALPAAEVERPPAPAGALAAAEAGHAGAEARHALAAAEAGHAGAEVRYALAAAEAGRTPAGAECAPVEAGAATGLALPLPDGDATGDGDATRDATGRAASISGKHLPQNPICE